MVEVVSIVAAFAVAGAVVSWVVGAVFYIKTLRAVAVSAPPKVLLQAIVAWPFVRNRLTGEPASSAAVVNKALVAFFACLIVAVSAISVATNLARVTR